MRNENNDYLSKQIITYLGNKRKLLKEINDLLILSKLRLNKTDLITLDLFSGSGIVSRLMKSHSALVISNDLEKYSEVINRCYLSNKNDIDFRKLSYLVDSLNTKASLMEKPNKSIFEDLYAPNDDKNILKDERAFYTKSNSRKLDIYANQLNLLGEDLYHLLMGPLLSKASVHVNTSGVFKSFYKDKNTKIGKFGGTNANALSRILGEIKLEVPVLSNYSSESLILRKDANLVIEEIDDVDVAYIDPPYNEHPYGANYFMLNLLCEFELPKEISRNSGIPKDWNRSVFNKKTEATKSLINLLTNLKSKIIILSYSSESFTKLPELLSELNTLGKVTVKEIDYPTFKGSRNIQNREKSISEYLFMIEKK